MRFRYTYPVIPGIRDALAYSGSREREKDSAISKPSIARSAAMMSTATTLSRVSGFLRMWATAYALGATGLMSAYSVANNIPNMIFELAAGGIISSLFIPTFMELRENKDEETAWRFTSHVFNLTVLVLGLVGVIGTLFPVPFVWTQTFRMPANQSAAVVTAATFFFRFFAIQVVLYGAGSVISAVLNSQRRYFWPAVGPIFNNVVAIATMIAFVALRGNLGVAMVVLAAGTTLAVFVMFAVQVPALFQSGWRHSWGLGLHDPALRRMLWLAVPTVIYVVTNLVAVSFRNASAFAVPGLNGSGPSILTYAWIFYQLPYGILAVALATAVFTELADAAGRQNNEEFKATFLRGLRTTGVLMLPTSALLIALATPLVSLYRVGAFAESDVPLVVGALRWWASGLIFYASTMFLLRTFYSLKDTRTPMNVNLGLTVVQIGLYVVLSTGIGSWPGLGINGLPIADVVFFTLSSVTLAVLLRRRIGGYNLRGVGSVFGRMLAASVIAASAAWLMARALAPLLGGIGGSLLQVAVGGIAGLAIAVALGRLFGVSEVAVAIDGFKRLVSRSRKRGGE
jgi:putative peptidoglycan lipid II flippase